MKLMACVQCNVCVPDFALLAYRRGTFWRALLTSTSVPGLLLLQHSGDLLL